MVAKDTLYGKIIKELEMEDGLKARVIARRLSVDRSEVNSILYSRKYRAAFRRDGYYKWYLAEERVPRGIILDAKPIIVENKQEETKSSCKNCMLCKSGMCFGEKTICENYKNSPKIPEFEMEMWPREMSGPYGTLHKNRQ